MTSYARYRIVSRGMIGSAQTWSFGLTTNSVGPLSQADLNSFATAVQGLFGTFWDATHGLRDYNANIVTATGVDVYFYPAGATSASMQATSDFTVAKAGTSGAGKCPQRTAVVASLRTGLPGRTNRGRSYLPATGFALGADLQFAALDVDNLVSTYANYLSSINALTTFGGPGVVVIPSALATVPPPVTLVNMDTLPDNQLRRSDKTGATHTAVDVV